MKALLRSFFGSFFGAATQLFWRCYAAFLAAVLALLRSFFGGATQLFWRCYHGRISRGRQRERGRVRLSRPCHEEHEEKYTEKCKRNVLVFPVIKAFMSSLKLNPRISSTPIPATHTFIRSISDRPG
jgi:hypothetical protein